jgi:hypothetical protein
MELVGFRVTRCTIDRSRHQPGKRLMVSIHRINNVGTQSFNSYIYLAHQLFGKIKVASAYFDAVALVHNMFDCEPDIVKNSTYGFHARLYTTNAFEVEVWSA